MAKTLSTERTINACPQSEEQIKERLNVNELNRSEDAKEANQRWRTLYTNWIIKTGKARIFAH